MGRDSFSNSCTGTLFDSGGPNEDYSSLENEVFTICPEAPHACIAVEMTFYDIEPEIPFFDGDVLRFFAGADITAPLIHEVRGFGGQGGTTYEVEVNSDCLTLAFRSDALDNFPGFELNWTCSPDICEGKSIISPEVIPQLPFTQTRVSTCTAGATFRENSCFNSDFLNGPEYVYAWDAPGGQCIEVLVEGADMGVAVFDGPPQAPGTNCVAQSSTGHIRSADTRQAGRYFIVTAREYGCTTFDINVREVDCIPPPTLENALCNPLNGCTMPTLLSFEDGREDIPMDPERNAGCWLNFGKEPDYLWFSIEVQAEGDLGFILESFDQPSDIDYNVWGPFSREAVCEDPESVQRFIRNNQPIRSSYSGGPEPTGLVRTHPQFQYAITDTFDCGGSPGAIGDNFTRVIEAKQGEVYLVLLNDFGDDILDGTIQIDWSPSSPDVLEAVLPEPLWQDSFVCPGDAIQLELTGGSNAAQWLNSDGSLSCTNCPSPVARPLERTTYQVAVGNQCVQDTLNITVYVLGLNEQEDIQLCQNGSSPLNVGPALPGLTYEWEVPPGLQLSCTDCPDPILTGNTPGAYTLTARQISKDCSFEIEVSVEILPESAPEYRITENSGICLGDQLRIGGAAVPGVSYNWSSRPSGFSSQLPNPSVSPVETTTYFLEVTNGLCPLSVFDSVRIEVFAEPVISMAGDTTLCEGETYLLATHEEEPGVRYFWQGPDLPQGSTESNPVVTVRQPGAYVLTAARGDCSVQGTVSVGVRPFNLELNTRDTALCRGTTLALQAVISPEDALIDWSNEQGEILKTSTELILTPEVSQTIFVTLNTMECTLLDSVRIRVDSLPDDLSIQPVDTTVCEGVPVVLQSAVFEPSDFSSMEVVWTPLSGQQSPDTLFNLVVTPDTTTWYVRTLTNGACLDVDSARVEVILSPALELRADPEVICVGDFVQLAAVSSEALDASAWSPEESLSCTDCLTPTANPLVSTTFQFQASFQGCPVSGSIQVMVEELGSLQFPDEPVICPGNGIVLNLLSDPEATYEWTSPDDADFFSIEAQPLVSPPEDTRYQVRLNDPECGMNTFELLVEVVEPASIELIASAERICPSTGVDIFADLEGGAAGGRFRWLGSDSTEFTGQQIFVMPLQTTTYTLFYSDAAGCQLIQDQITIAVDPELEVQISTEADLPVPQGAPLELRAILVPELPTGYQIRWLENGTLLPDATGLTVLVNPPLPLENLYEVFIESPDGCVYEASLLIPTTVPQVEIPNAFTPDGDGRNDHFALLFPGTPPEVVNFRIFNRWGEIVFNQPQAQPGWDGTTGGKPQPSDVYIYVVEIRNLNGEIETLKGDLTLIR